MTRRNAVYTLVSIIIALVVSGVSFIYLRRKRIILLPSNYKDIISEIAEVIIPRTDTPGAKDAGVDKYISNVIEFCLSKRDKNIMIVGLNSVDDLSVKKYSLPFIKCSNAQRISIVTHFQNKGIFKSSFLNTVKRKLLGPSFFELIKDLTVNGYCVSKLGATVGLAYDHVPGEYLGCIPIIPGQHCWATA